MNEGYYNHEFIDTEYETESSSSEEEIDIHSKNIGIFYKANEIKENQLSIDQTRLTDYVNVRNKLFSPEIIKKRIIVDTNNLDHSNGHNTSSYKIEFTEHESKNKNGGFQNYRNVIGFQLISAQIRNSIYNVNSDNNTIKVYVQRAVPSIVVAIKTVTLDEGNYKFLELATEFKNKLNNLVDNEGTNANINGWNVTGNTKTSKYTIRNDTYNFKFDWGITNSSAWRLFGALNMNDTEYKAANTDYILPNVVQQTQNYVDLLIDEIPYTSCIHNYNGKKLISRIPLNAGPGEMVYYEPERSDTNYFFPINLSSLTLRLESDIDNKLYICQNNDNYFEFEISILNKN